jgi:exopolysaccharide biosynthesis polyprenyl glycosylphosphotransferase
MDPAPSEITRRRNDFLIPTIAVVIDAFAIKLAFLFSYWLRFDTDALTFLSLSEEIPPFMAYFYGSLVIIPIWLLIFKSRGMYGARRNVSLSDELFSIVKLVTLGMLVVMSAAFFYRAFSYSRVVFGLLWIASILFVFSGRFLLNHIERSLYRRGRDLRNAVIIGSNTTAQLIYRTLHNHPLLGYRLVGYFADEPTRDPTGTDDRFQNLKYLGRVQEVPAGISQHHIDLALISLGYGDYPKLYDLIRNSEGVNVEFMMVPDMLEIMAGGMRMREIEGIPFIQIKGLPMTTWGGIAKRLFDLTIGLALSVLLFPFLLLVAVLVKLESRGPVFYRQERVGMDGKSFNMLKFRSMRMAAERETGPVWATEDDPRRTRVGRILRRTSIDELPQLINVLRGEMSLVGPRPERPHFVKQFRDLVPKYLDRHRVRTGMTGWAQVNGLRGNTSLTERIKYDIYYIENWSLWFDMKILFKTIRAIVWPKDAY